MSVVKYPELKEAAELVESFMDHIELDDDTHLELFKMVQRLEELAEGASE